MPRIPVRTTPYHALPRCTRHYKSKRDLILRSLGKASFINGSQFVIAWISPKGETDIFASELLQEAVNGKGEGVLNKKALEQEAKRVKGEMAKRWDDIKRMEEKGEAPSIEDDAADENGEEEDGEEMDGDRTLVEENESMETPLKGNGPFSISQLKRPSPSHMMSTFSAATRSSTPAAGQGYPVNLAPDAILNFYMERFTNIQQQTCKLVVKAWIKVIEPKKQMKYPYNKGEEFKPDWWPAGVKHREPDHLPKEERKQLLACILRSPLVSVARLELSTAEATAYISPPKVALLREIYIVAKEEERMRLAGESDQNLLVYLPNAPVSPSAVSPDGGSEKRSHNQFVADNKENVDMSMANPYSSHPQKRHKHSGRPQTLAIPNQAGYDTSYTNSPSPFNYAPSHLSGHVWREAPAHALSPYPHSGSEVAWSEYSRSPNPEAADQQQQQPRAFHNNHLAPILNHGNATSPMDSPAFGHSAAMQSSASAPGYYPRSAGSHSYMQQQQMDYLHQHQHQPQPEGFNYGSPYIADQSWDQGYSQAA
ncbi:hypothetical protein CI109_100408 [Kwoniella shandongensis]|uniref:Subtelomeric hrmA-associated cluster protein AFUB-079030/YDR124W-like helical bundle domain-containing protein n=1 Tax=Kwoniella shandongensis TaxID=1734106 RepID=A0A5M6C9D8_9TREE|nr:uncharacterized protein CI109_001749 [Kwoniella shandongensis]KAA5529809.1 hypothetical protein CI109_001749 [Kwoniella shandongensis]